MFLLTAYADDHCPLSIRKGTKNHVNSPKVTRGPPSTLKKLQESEEGWGENAGGWLNIGDPKNCQAIKRRICDTVHGQFSCPRNASVHGSVHEETLASVSKLHVSLHARGEGSAAFLVLACQLRGTLHSPGWGAVISNHPAASGCSAAIAEVSIAAKHYSSRA